MRFVVSLGDLDQDDLATAGGKAANLGELVRAGFPVPNGFVVTTDAYATVIQPLDLKIPERIAAGEGASVRADIETAPMPADLRTEIANAYAALGTGPVAVRSSATAEDLPGAAFAGQQDTYLNVVGRGGADRCGTVAAGDHCGPSAPSPTAAGSRSIPQTSESRSSYNA